MANCNFHDFINLMGDAQHQQYYLRGIYQLIMTLFVLINFQKAHVSLSLSLVGLQLAHVCIGYREMEP